MESAQGNSQRCMRFAAPKIYAFYVPLLNLRRTMLRGIQDGDPTTVTKYRLPAESKINTQVYSQPLILLIRHYRLYL